MMYNQIGNHLHIRRTYSTLGLFFFCFFVYCFEVPDWVHFLHDWVALSTTCCCKSYAIKHITELAMNYLICYEQTRWFSNHKSQPAFAITYNKVNHPKMTFDPTSVDVKCVTLPKDNCIQAPWKYIKVCIDTVTIFQNLRSKGRPSFKTKCLRIWMKKLVYRVWFMIVSLTCQKLVQICNLDFQHSLFVHYKYYLFVLNSQQTFSCKDMNNFLTY